MKRTWIFWILMLLYLGAVAFLCFGKFESMPKMSKTFLGFETDKVIHFCMFLPYAVLLYFSFDKLKRKPLGAILFALGSFLSGAILAAGTEFVQSGLVYRTADVLDFKADALALATGSLLILIVNCLIKEK